MTMAAGGKTNLGGAGGYDVGRAGGKCHISGRAIAPGEKFMAALRETPSGFERLDIAPEHWAEFDKSNSLAFWQTVMPEPQQKKRLFVDDAVLCELFERLGDVTEPAKVNFRFVLGLILMRKRMVVYETTRAQDGKEIWVVHIKGKEEKLDLVNPRLDEQQVAEVSTQLGQILNESL